MGREGQWWKGRGERRTSNGESQHSRRVHCFSAPSVCHLLTREDGAHRAGAHSWAGSWAVKVSLQPGALCWAGRLDCCRRWCRGRVSNDQPPLGAPSTPVALRHLAAFDSANGPHAKLPNSKIMSACISSSSAIAGHLAAFALRAAACGWPLWRSPMNMGAGEQGRNTHCDFCGRAGPQRTPAAATSRLPPLSRRSPATSLHPLPRPPPLARTAG